MVRVKICGITNIEDALAAVEAGADALGFVFAESPRKVGVDEARRIRNEVPSSIAMVGVFANQTEQDLFSIMEQTELSIAQVHGDMTISEPNFRFGLIRALRIRSLQDILQATEDPLLDSCWAILLDTHVEGKMGGTGLTFDWDLALQARVLEKEIILAGGLTPGNVSEAIHTARPDWVDVSTGVEASPGKKDHQKIKEFIENAKRCG